MIRKMLAPGRRERQLRRCTWRDVGLKRSLLISGLGAASLLAAPAHTQPAPADLTDARVDAALSRQGQIETAGEFGALLIRTGVTMATSYAGSQREAPPPLPPGAVTPAAQALQQILTNYQGVVRLEADLRTTREYATILVDGASAASLLLPGWGLALAPVIKAIGQVTVDSAYGAALERAREIRSEVLTELYPQVMAHFNQAYQEGLGDTNAIRQRVMDHADMQAYLDRVIEPNDIQGQRVARQLIDEGVRNMIVALDDQVRVQGRSIEQLANRVTEVEGAVEALNLDVEVLAGNVENIDNRLRGLTNAFVGFAENTSRTLELHAGALRGLNLGVSNLQAAMHNIQGRVATLQNNAAFVNDFVFNSMTPSQKAHALRGGFLAERFSCPESGPCPPETMRGSDREALIDQFEAEAEIQAAVNRVGEIVQGMAGIATIANNLGIDIPGLNEAVRISSVALQAFTSFAEGGPLGVIGGFAAISSLFAGRVDPDQERFNALIGYLDEQFAALRNDLAAVYQLQQETLEAVGEVARLVAETYEALDARFDYVSRRLNDIENVAQAILNRPWTACQNIFNSANGVAYQNGRFTSLQPMYRVITNLGGATLDRCLDYASDSIGVLNSRWQANVLNMAYLLDLNTPAGSPQQETIHTAAARFISEIHNPSLRILQDYYATASFDLPGGAVGSITPPFIAQLLLAPAGSVAAAEAGQRAVAAQGASNTDLCGLAGWLSMPMRPFLCEGIGPAGNSAADVAARANRLLTAAPHPEFALDLSSWLLLTSNIANLGNHRENVIQVNIREGLSKTIQWATNDEELAFLVEAEANAPRAGRGAELLASVVTLLDAAIIGHGVVYGDQLSLAIADAFLQAGNAGASTLDLGAPLMAQNGFLATNVATIALHQRYRAEHGGVSPPFIAYNAAYHYALTTEADPTLLLRAMFGTDLEFAVLDGSVWLVLVPPPSEGQLVPLNRAISSLADALRPSAEQATTCVSTRCPAGIADGTRLVRDGVAAIRAAADLLLSMLAHDAAEVRNYIVPAELQEAINRLLAIRGPGSFSGLTTLAPLLVESIRAFEAAMSGPIRAPERYPDGPSIDEATLLSAIDALTAAINETIALFSPGGVALPYEPISVLAELLPPEQFAAGRLLYPESMQALINQRNLVIERLADYRALDGLTREEIDLAAQGIARAAQIELATEP